MHPGSPALSVFELRLKICPNNIGELMTVAFFLQILKIFLATLHNIR
ncbi:hypothetical protein N878_07910 [Pseudomonas sp. EGD-AK9]|nr:hypothetical protein N878_07910 [Pseudomonas sp. EGD-AK9]